MYIVYLLMLTINCIKIRMIKTMIGFVTKHPQRKSCTVYSTCTVFIVLFTLPSQDIHFGKMFKEIYHWIIFRHSSIPYHAPSPAAERSPSSAAAASGSASAVLTRRKKLLGDGLSAAQGHPQLLQEGDCHLLYQVPQHQGPHQVQHHKDVEETAVQVHCPQPEQFSVSWRQPLRKKKNCQVCSQHCCCESSSGCWCWKGSRWSFHKLL